MIHDGIAKLKLWLNHSGNRYMAATIALIGTHICPNLAAQQLWGPADRWTDTEGAKMEIMFPRDMGFLCRGVANKSDRRRGKATIWDRSVACMAKREIARGVMQVLETTCEYFRRQYDIAGECGYDKGRKQCVSTILSLIDHCEKRGCQDVG